MDCIIDLQRNKQDLVKIGPINKKTKEKNLKIKNCGTQSEFLPRIQHKIVLREIIYYH